MLAANPDMVDRIFEYLLQEVPEMLTHIAGTRIEQAKQAVRDEFAGQEAYIRVRTASTAEELAHQVLSLFNGRNATEVARKLQISRATVYRKLKQARRHVTPATATKKTSQPSGK
jgi:Mor family transcriptional regulator